MNHWRVLDEASFESLTAGATVLDADARGAIALRLADGSRLELRPAGFRARLLRLFRRLGAHRPAGLIAAYRAPGFEALHFRTGETTDPCRDGGARRAFA